MSILASVQQVTDDIVISREDVYDLLSKLEVSKAAGPDEIPARLLKEGALWLAKPLATIFTLSLSQGCLPHDWTSTDFAQMGSLSGQSRKFIRSVY